jgi:hypothetical protein
MEAEYGEPRPAFGRGVMPMAITEPLVVSAGKEVEALDQFASPVYDALN